MSEMGANTQAEDLLTEKRWRMMKGLRAMDLSFAEMVPLLQRASLLDCQNCALARESGERPDDGTPTRRASSKKTRRNRKGEEICTTCENTITQQWNRNIDRLKEDEIQLVERRWKWFATNEWIVATARKDYRQLATTKTVKRKKIDPIPGMVWSVRVKLESGEFEERLYPAESIEGIAEIVEETTREEWRIYPQLLDIMMEANDKMARVAGLPVDEVGDPDAEKRDRELMRGGLLVKRPANRTNGDRRGTGGEPSVN